MNVPNVTSPNGTAPDPARPDPPQGRGWLRRIAAGVLIGVLVYGLLWYTVFNAVTAALVASGGTVVLLAGASASDIVETIFDAIANVLLGILAAIAAFFAAILSFFDF
jgi:choline-glycine betaine transporter